MKITLTTLGDWPSLNGTIFITHVRYCEMGATPMEDPDEMTHFIRV